ncbi:MAG TPA: hypothetical protein VLL75_08780 [Vicinamibacteria bacterium]|nr:hypothetical protein [Vicinamibacteria bacterium]
MSKALILQLAALATVAAAGAGPAAASDDLAPERVDRVNVLAESVEYRGKRALRLVEAPGATADTETLAVLRGSSFRDGTIEIEVSGAPRAGTEGAGARGFVGVAFRLKDPVRYECFYLRPTNGRAEDQLRRNHSTQYISHPAYPWHRLRKESPGVYESYVDLVPGEWTRVRIVVSGTEARLFVHGAEQPALIVKDLKLGASEGGIALWIGPGTEAHFSDLRVVPR